MIIGPNKGVFFVVTVLLYAASLYGAQSFSATDPMTRIFVGEPNRLTVPPGFHEASTNSASKADCTSQPDAERLPPSQSEADQAPDAQPCTPLAAQTTGPVAPAPTVDAVSGEARVIVQPASAASAVAPVSNRDLIVPTY
jgi:hypothetical protein